MQYLKIRNWERYQHYKTDHPPWIKLHSKILLDYDFSKLSDTAWRCAVSLMLVASKTGNKIPHDPYWIRNQCAMEKMPDLQPLLNIGFLVHEENSRESLESLYENCASERETERERETEKKILRDESRGLFSEWWETYRSGIAPRPLRDKQSCLKLWRAGKFTEEQQKALLVKLQSQIDYRRQNGNNGSFVPALPDPIRYLKRRLWHEEIRP